MYECESGWVSVRGAALSSPSSCPYTRLLGDQNRVYNTVVISMPKHHYISLSVILKLVLFIFVCVYIVKFESKFAFAIIHIYSNIVFK